MSNQATLWFDFASTYSYLTLQRAETLAAAAGVSLQFRPFLLGPIFGAQGWSTSPFLVYPAKGAFMMRDMQRRAAARGLPFKQPPTFPVNSSLAGKWGVAALAAAPGPAAAGERFCVRVSRAHWGEGRDIAEAAELSACAEDVGLDPEAIAASAATPDIRPRLRQNTETAQALGIFGAPSVTVERDGAAELFWGDDQFEDALSWAVRGALAPKTPPNTA